MTKEWKTAEIKRQIYSVKSAELFSLDYGAAVSLKGVRQTVFIQADKTDVDDRLTDNKRLTQICSTYHRQNELALAGQC